VANSIVRLPYKPSLAIFAGVTRAVEIGFMAAGITVGAFAAIQSIFILSSWVASL